MWKVYKNGEYLNIIIDKDTIDDIFISKILNIEGNIFEVNALNGKIFIVPHMGGQYEDVYIEYIDTYELIEVD